MLLVQLFSLSLPFLLNLMPMSLRAEGLLSGHPPSSDGQRSGRAARQAAGLHLAARFGDLGEAGVVRGDQLRLLAVEAREGLRDAGRAGRPARRERDAPLPVQAAQRQREGHAVPVADRHPPDAGDDVRPARAALLLDLPGGEGGIKRPGEITGHGVLRYRPFVLGRCPQSTGKSPAGQDVFDLNLVPISGKARSLFYAGGMDNVVK